MACRTEVLQRPESPGRRWRGSKDSPIADPTVSSSVALVVLIRKQKGGGLAMLMVEVAVVVRVEGVCV